MTTRSERGRKGGTKLPGPKRWNFRDLKGRRFGKLVVQKYAGPGERGARWVCRCDCGGILERSGPRLIARQRAGRYQHCGECEAPRTNQHAPVDGPVAAGMIGAAMAALCATNENEPCLAE